MEQAQDHDALQDAWANQHRAEEAYTAAKQAWQSTHPNATPAQHSAAMSRIAAGLGI